MNQLIKPYNLYASKLLLGVVCLVGFVGMFFSTNVYAQHELGGATGVVYVREPSTNQKIYLPGMHLHRQVWLPQTNASLCLNDAFHKPLATIEYNTGSNACWIASQGRLAVTDTGGKYSFTNSSQSGCGTGSGGAYQSKVGWIGAENSCGGYQAMSCAEWIHRWVPYFPQGYDIAQATGNPFILNSISFDNSDLFGGGTFQTTASATSRGALLNSAEACKNHAENELDGVVSHAEIDRICNEMFPWTINPPSWAPNTKTSLATTEYFMLANQGNLGPEGNFDFEWIPSETTTSCGQGCAAVGAPCNDGSTCQDIGGGNLVCVGSDYAACDVNLHIQNGCSCPAAQVCNDQCATVGAPCSDGTVCQATPLGNLCVGGDYQVCEITQHISNGCACPPPASCGQQCTTPGSICSDGTVCQNTPAGMLCVGADVASCDILVHVNQGCSCPPPGTCGQQCTTIGQSCGDGTVCQATSVGNMCVGADYQTCDIMMHIGNSCFCPSAQCGDGICNHPSESCDGPVSCVNAGEFSSGECRPLGDPNACTYCGDGIVQGGEECDDGNIFDDDDCSNSCRATTICGNNRCDPQETCDNLLRCIGEGWNEGECRLEPDPYACTYCGDGIMQAGEECDDGNNIDSDGCTNACTRTLFCGDGIISPGEECEPGVSQCGPGATCNALTCLCDPVQPGLCGSACVGDYECPVGNTCYNGRCRLNECVPQELIIQTAPSSAPISGPQPSAVVIQSRTCDPSGCSFIECGGPCGANRACPDGLACSEDGRCIFPYCIRNQCADDCVIPHASEEGKEMPIYLLSLLLIVLGVLAYRLDLSRKGWEVFKLAGGRFLIAKFSSVVRREVEQEHKEKSSKKFEEKLEKKMTKN
jgi:cysteine-rich repeat protein